MFTERSYPVYVLVQSNAQGYVPESSLVCLLKLVCNVTFSAGLTKACSAGFLSEREKNKKIM